VGGKEKAVDKINSAYMKNHIEMKFEFLKSDVATIDIRVGKSVINRNYALLVLFATFALRQMRNMGGKSHPISESLAIALSTCQDPSVPLVTVLGPSKFQWNLLKVYKKYRDGAPDPMKNFRSVDIVKLVPYKDQVGKKRFIASISYDDYRALLQLYVQGFNILGFGVNYYAPLSVGLLLKQLASFQPEDSQFIANLTATARLCGAAIAANFVTRTNQSFVSVQIIKKAIQFDSA
jgi:hypothetical protein